MGNYLYLLASPAATCRRKLWAAFSCAALCLIHSSTLADGSGATNVHLSVATQESLLRLTVTGEVQPGAFYTLETAGALGGGQPWAVLEPVQAATNAITYDLVPPSDQAAFFRVRLPQPALFRVEPAIGSAAGGANLFVIGQCLGTNGQVRIGGQTVPASPEQPGAVYRCVTPALPEGVYDVEWIEDGQVVARAPKAFTVTGQPTPLAQRSLEPPAEPPASPERAKKIVKFKAGAELADKVNRSAVASTGDLDADGFAEAVALSMPALDAASKDAARLALRGGEDDCDGLDLLPATGELRLQVCDVVVPGVGLDFAFVRTYRSRTGRTTPMGHGWDHSYNLYIEAEGDDIAVCDGTGRRDVMFRQADGTFSRDEFFWHGRWDATNDNFILEFPGKGLWEFYHFGVRPAGGRIARIADANGNEMLFTYNLSSQLTEITDTLGRTFTFSYNLDGLLTQLADFTGRVWTYAYHTNGSPGGSAGDLASVTTPAVTNTPTGNDFPDGKTTTYTYSRGAGDDRLNHNLTSITDPKGQTWLQVTYHTNTNPAEIDFDALASIQRGIEKKDLWRGVVTASPSNRYAVVRCVVRDGVGNVCETFCDSLNRPVIVRQFTGRSDTNSPVTDVANRPTGKLRAEDPDYYETAFEWNRDSLLTRYVWPDGDQIRCVYERDFDPAASPRKKGDLRVHREHSVAVGDLDGDGQADIAERVWRLEHDPRFGSPDPGLRSGGNSTTRGGSVTMNSQTSSTRLGGGGGVGKAQLQDFHFTRVTDPRGNVTTATYDDHGNLLQTSTTDRKSGAIIYCDYDYDARGRLTRCVQPADAEGRRRQDAFTYYTNGPMAGYLATAVCDDGGLNLTTTFEYDARGNLTRCVNPRGHDTLWAYNALDQVVQTQSPPAGGGQRVTTRFFYDANDNLVQVDHENRDASGALDANNPWWTSFAEFDALNRPTLLCHEVTHVVQQGTVFLTNRLTWDANNNLIRREGPRAVSGEAPHNQVVCTYDERGLLFTTVSAPGTGLSATNRWDYDGKGDFRRVSKIDAITIKQKIVEHALGELRRATDAAGNVTLFSYDRAGNLIRVRHFGETNDVPGSTHNILLAETRYEYDSLNRCVLRWEPFFDIFTSQPIGDGAATHAFVLAPNGQLVSETDDLGRTTRYTYDTAGRCVAITDPATNRVEFIYDAAGNVTLVRQLDRSDLGGPEQAFLLTRTYDACDRLIRETDNVGNTTQFAYDSRDHCVRVTDPRGHDSAYQYDGLSRCVRSTDYEGAVEAGVTIHTTHVEYQDSRLLSVTDGNSNVTRYAYDSLDRCVAVTNADGTVTQFAYDAFDNLAQTRDANGTLVTATYDLLDRCVRRDITPGPGVADATTFESFAYDGRSLLVLASNNVSRCGFTWDSLGNCRSATQDGFTLSQTCDSLGNPLSLTLPSGRSLTSIYDALNRPTALNLVAGGRVTPLATLAYEGPGRLGRIARANGINTRLNWNGTLNPPNQPGDFGWQQVVRVNHARAQGGAVIDQRGYAYDHSQNKTLRAQLVPFVQGGPLLTNRWQADALDRLTQSVRQTGAGESFRQYQLDPNGNRQVVIEDGVAQPYTMDATLPEPADFQMNQYTASPFGEYLYDPNGNRVHMQTGTGEFLLTYDYADRLVRVERLSNGAPVTLFTYTYDALGRRITRTFHPEPPLAPQVTRYVHHPEADCVVEEWRDGALHTTLPQAGGGAASAAYASTGRIVIPAGGTPVYVLSDELGNALALTDAAGNVLERYDYDDFGQPRFLDAEGNPLVDGGGLPVNASLTGLDWLYRGAYWNAALGLHEVVCVGECDLPADFDPFNAAPLTGMKIDGGMPNRISMNVTVPKQSQGATFGERMKAHGKVIEKATSGLKDTLKTQVRMAGGSPKKREWLPANFRLRIDGLDELCSRVVEKATSGLKDTLKTQVRMAGGRKLLDRGEAGDNVGLLLRATKKEEGGRHTPFQNKYRPQFFFRAQSGSGTLPASPAQEHRKLLDRGEAGDNVGLLLRSGSNVLKNKHDTVKNSIMNIR